MMDISTKFTRLLYLKELIQKEKLKSPTELAQTFECSEKTVRRMINTLRDVGVDIHYCKRRKKYFIENAKRTLIDR